MKRVLQLMKAGIPFRFDGEHVHVTEASGFGRIDRSLTEIEAIVRSWMAKYGAKLYNNYGEEVRKYFATQGIPEGDFEMLMNGAPSARTFWINMRREPSSSKMVDLMENMVAHNTSI